MNYKHLRAFWAVAKEGGLHRGAERLNVSPSALSVQIQELETRFGRPLFDRRGRSMTLTEAGRIALEHADAIFAIGDELASVMADASQAAKRPLRIGASATLSRNFQLEFLKPLIGAADVRFVLQSGAMADMTARLEAHALDVVLTNAPPLQDDAANWAVHLIDRQRVSLIGRADRAGPRDWRAVLRESPLILPGPGATVRAGFDALLQKLGVRPHVVAEIDDMAMLRVLTRAGAGVAVAPPIVMRDELASGGLEEIHVLPDLEERFLAVAPTGGFMNPVLERLLNARAQDAAAA